ncbi:BofC C-terminal domain-containing protein [Paraliobacillus salinarum]|uniref:BofC C-terminal domain-containing protein n=1 Tax=Paraliobacillus salinarum TaxID=1158996 RepID=UPI0015F4B039|nr:BofC C-terminal domain-containing protein [Paraliobacillus salinarum]
MKSKFQLFVFAILLFLAGFSTHAAIVKENESADDLEDKTTEVTNSTQVVANEPLQLTVTLQKQYLDGKIEESSEEQTIYAMEDFWSMYEGWQLVDQNQEEMVFRQQVDDISPYLKKSGYFGLQNSMLSIFEGEPIHQQVIQSFYQIDTETLESRQIEALEKGIQIESKEKYLQVLEMYRDLSPTKQVQG